MSHFAAALARSDDAWVGQELDLGSAEDLDTVVDMLRDLSEEEQSAQVTLLLVEEDDEWFAVVRLDEQADTDPRIFLSDFRVVDSSGLAGALFPDVGPEAPEGGGDDDERRVPAGEPAGDAELLADLGTSKDKLLELIAEEGLLPGDILTALAESAGCADVLESLREG